MMTGADCYAQLIEYHAYIVVSRPLDIETYDRSKDEDVLPLR